MNKKDLEDLYFQEALKVKHMRAFIRKFAPVGEAKRDLNIEAIQLLNIPVSKAEESLTNVKGAPRAE